MKSRLINMGAFAATIALAFCMVGCGSSQTTYSVGETVETDVVKFTLERAELAIALENSGAASVGYGATGLADDSYFMPKEYDASEDADNPYVAAKGHTLVSMTFTAECLDRDFVNLDGKSYHEKFFVIEYGGKKYTGDDIEVEYGVENENGKGWENYSSSNILLSPQETSSFKAYVDIPVEINNLSSSFKVTFNLPTSKDETQAFTYLID